MEIKEKLEEITAPAAGPVLDMVSGLLLEGAAGAIVPGVGNLILAYKQQRTEKNLEVFISQIVARQDEFNERLNRLDPEKLEKITGHYFGIVTDYVLNVRQQEKIHFIVNGYLRLSETEGVNDDTVMMYYDTLDQLTLMDIAVMKSHHRLLATEENEEYMNILIPGQKHLIHEKLSHLGLVSSENEQRMNKNLQNIANYLLDMQKGKKNAKLKCDKIWGSDSYRLTDYGRKFLEIRYRPDREFLHILLVGFCHPLYLAHHF